MAKSKADSTAATPPAPLTDEQGQPLRFDAAIEQLESLIHGIESGQIELEEALAAYEKGTHLIAHCKFILDRAESQIKKLSVQDESADDSSAP